MSGQGQIFDAANQQAVDNNANGCTYFGEALPGTATSAAGWKIQRMITVGGAQPYQLYQYANGDVGFVNVWDNRTTLVYA